ncbi:MAG: cytochrome C [Xanthobacter sp. 17-67-6]|nr:MAG: cytochrome C [Xanthobacter sp. 17-67-6]
MSKSAEALLLAIALAALPALPAFAGPPVAAPALAAPAAAASASVGRPALPEEIAAWDIDVRPDGQGLPPGKGSVKEGEEIFLQNCAVCHGEFGEGAGRWPVLAGGQGSLKSERPEKTIGSFWPYASTAYDYIHRAMPFGNAQSLEPNQVYAIVAYLLNLNDVVKDDFVLSRENFPKVTLPNVGAFYDDDRETAEKAFWNANPCMKDCSGEVKVTGHARILNVTPKEGEEPKGNLE